MDINPPGSKMAPKTHTIPRKGDAMALSGKAAKSHPIFVTRNVVSPMRSSKGSHKAEWLCGKRSGNEMKRIPAERRVQRNEVCRDEVSTPQGEETAQRVEERDKKRKPAL